MTTLFCIFILIVFGVIANFLSLFIVNIAGIPGGLLAGSRRESTSLRFWAGVIVAFLGQAYIYLAFVAFVVNWTLLAAAREDVVGWPLYPFAFLSSTLPIWICQTRARLEARETGEFNAQVEALHLTTLLSTITFFIFFFLPSIINYGWSWIPYLN